VRRLRTWSRFVEVCIVVQKTATCALTLRMIERNEFLASCDKLPHRCGGMSTNMTDREEVNEQCRK
jgi:hypothetical protein